MGLLDSIIGKFKNAVRERLIINKKTNSIQLLLDMNHEQYFTLTFDEMIVNTPMDTNVFNAYSIKTKCKKLGSLYIEAIRLHNINSWNLSAGSAFDSFLKNELSNHKLEYISSTENDICNLKKYTLNNDFDIGVIWFTLNSYELFIVDQKGTLFNDLLDMYSINDNNLIITVKEHEEISIKNSLTQNNVFENYF